MHTSSGAQNTKEISTDPRVKQGLHVVDRTEEEKLCELFQLSGLTLVGLQYLMMTSRQEKIVPDSTDTRLCSLTAHERDLMVQVGLVEGQGKHAYPSVTRTALKAVIAELMEEGSPFFPRPSEKKFYVGGI